MISLHRATFALALLLTMPAMAKLEASDDGSARKLAAADTGASDASSSSAEPQKTSATFGDWIVRCDLTGTPPKKVCEAVQTFSIKGNQNPFAQVVFAHVPGSAGAAAGGPLTMLLILPVNIALDKQPSLAVGTDSKTIQLLRCLPEGCVASAPVAADVVKQLRGAKGASASFFDAANQKINLPLSPKGFSQALEPV